MTVSTNVRGIVIATQPIRERDRLYTLYTQELGKIVVHGVGTRKLQSKLAGSMEPFAEVDCMLIRAKMWPKLGGAVVYERYDALRKDLSHLNAARFIADVVDATTNEGLPDVEHYRTLLNMYQWLNSHEVQRLAVYSFVVKWASIYGSDITELAGPTAEIQKITKWCVKQEYSEIAKLRITQEQWNSMQQNVHIWLEDNASRRVHSEMFLV